MAKAPYFPLGHPDHRPYFYQDSAGKWRWKVKSGNNELYAAAHQGFKSREEAEDNFFLCKNSMNNPWPASPQPGYPAP